METYDSFKEAIKTSQERREEYLKKGKDDLNKASERVNETTQFIKEKIQEIQRKGEEERSGIKEKIENQIQSKTKSPGQEDLKNTEQSQSKDSSTEKLEEVKQKSREAVERLKGKWNSWREKSSPSPPPPSPPLESSSPWNQEEVNNNEPVEVVWKDTPFPSDEDQDKQDKNP